MSSLEPPPPSHSIQHEKNSVHGYSGNILNKRRRTGDDLLDAFLEISDIMTYNQMQPIAKDSKAIVHNEIEMIDNLNTVHNNIHSENGSDIDNNENNNTSKKDKRHRNGRRKNQDRKNKIKRKKQDDIYNSANNR